jgi:negative regulator of flagellin synthesis FlgM
VAVNLGGIQLSGAAIGNAREVPHVRNAKSNAEDSAAAPQAGEVNITSTATLLSRLGQALGAQPAVDGARVSSLSRAVEDGTYRVEPDRIAAGLLLSERSLAQLPFTES